MRNRRALIVASVTTAVLAVIVAIANLSGTPSHEAGPTTSTTIEAAPGDCSFPHLPVPPCNTRERLAAWKQFYVQSGATRVEAACLARVIDHATTVENAIEPTPADDAATRRCVASHSRATAIAASLASYLVAHPKDVMGG
jgi:hypothetical protein